jgi:hypothetical protein
MHSADGASPSSTLCVGGGRPEPQPQVFDQFLKALLHRLDVSMRLKVHHGVFASMEGGGETSVGISTPTLTSPATAEGKPATSPSALPMPRRAKSVSLRALTALARQHVIGFYKPAPLQRRAKLQP